MQIITSTTVDEIVYPFTLVICGVVMSEKLARVIVIVLQTSLQIPLWVVYVGAVSPWLRRKQVAGLKYGW